MEAQTNQLLSGRSTEASMGSKLRAPAPVSQKSKVEVEPCN